MLCGANNYGVATLEGRLLARWREFLGMTQGELGAKVRPEPIEYKAVSRYETGKSSMSVATLLAAIKAMEAVRAAAGRPYNFGSRDEIKLVTFFQGPELVDVFTNAERVVALAGKELRGLRKARTP